MAFEKRHAPYRRGGKKPGSKNKLTFAKIREEAMAKLGAITRCIQGEPSDFLLAIMRSPWTSIPI